MEKIPKGVINYNNFFDKSSKTPKLDLLMDTKETYVDDLEVHYLKKEKLYLQ